LSQRYLREEPLPEVEQKDLEEVTETWRERLTSVSWLLTHGPAQRPCPPQGQRGRPVHRSLPGGAVLVLRPGDNRGCSGSERGWAQGTSCGEG